MTDLSRLDQAADWLARERPTAHVEVAAKARLLLLDVLACAIAGLRKPAVQAYANSLFAHARGDLALPGIGGSMGPLALGQVLAVAACWDEACEGLAAAHGRPGLHAMPAALAAGLARGASLGETLDAAVAGYEIGGRIGAALRIRPGMHVDGTWGTIAAAIAAAVVLSGRSQASIMHASNAAACTIPTSLYRPVGAGATVRNLYAGQAVARGIELALALKAGVSAPGGALEDAAALAFDEGRTRPFVRHGTWLILDGYFKPFAAVRHVHYGAQAALHWRARTGAAPGDIGALSLRIYPEAIVYCANRAPRTAIQAQFSLSYGLAHALVHGALGPSAYESEALNDPAAARLEAMLSLEADESFGERRGAVLSVTCAGTTETLRVDRVPGDPSSPMRAAEVETKFLAYAAPSLGERDAADLAGRILNAPLATSLGDVLAGTTPP